MKYIIKIAIILCLFIIEESYANNIIDNKTDTSVFKNILSFGIGFGTGLDIITNDMYHRNQLEVARINAYYQQNGKSTTFSASHYLLTLFANLFIDITPTRWMDINIFAEASTSGMGFYDDDAESDKNPDNYMSRYSFGLLPGYIFRIDPLIIIASAGILINRIEYRDYTDESNTAVYSNWGIGYRAKLTLKMDDEYRNPNKRVQYCIPRIKLFMLYTWCYAKDKDIKIGSWGILLGIEYNIFQI
jgi:hypothetical protein